MRKNEHPHGPPQQREPNNSKHDVIPLRTTSCLSFPGVVASCAFERSLASSIHQINTPLNYHSPAPPCSCLTRPAMAQQRKAIRKIDRSRVETWANGQVIGASWARTWKRLRSLALPRPLLAFHSWVPRRSSGESYVEHYPWWKEHETRKTTCIVGHSNGSPHKAPYCMFELRLLLRIGSTCPKEPQTNPKGTPKDPKNKTTQTGTGSSS